MCTPVNYLHPPREQFPTGVFYTLICMRKLRPREVRQPDKGHTARWWPNQDLASSSASAVRSAPQVGYEDLDQSSTNWTVRKIGIWPSFLSPSLPPFRHSSLSEMFAFSLANILDNGNICFLG